MTQSQQHKDEMLARVARRATEYMAYMRARAKRLSPDADEKYSPAALRAIRATTHNFRGELRR